MTPEEALAKKRVRQVYMMDLWSFIPYYLAALCKSLRYNSVEVVLGSARYHLDRQYFRKMGLQPDSCLLDFAGGIRSTRLRRPVKALEYVVNLLVLALRFSICPPDILHIQYLPFLERGFTLELWFLQWMKRAAVRRVYTVHNVVPQNTPNQFGRVLARAYQMMDVLICHSEEARSKVIQDFGVPAEKICVIPHGPLFDERPQMSPPEVRAKLRLPMNVILVLCLGVISEYKGIPFLLDAWKILVQRGGRGRLLVAGTGDPKIVSTIRQKILDEGLESSVELRSQFIPVEEVPLFYEAADILVYPYKAGTTSGALLTGLNYSKAVVATTLPFFQEHLTHGTNALMVEYGNVDELAKALGQLIDDPRERERLGRALGERSGSPISWDSIALSTIECYQTILQSSDVCPGVVSRGTES